MVKKIYPYIAGSKSARLLAQALGSVTLRRIDSLWRGTARDYIINWGSASLQQRGVARVINRPDAVARASNKISALRAMQEGATRVPDWTQNRATAQMWASEGHTVVVRRLVSASEGRGIEIVGPNGTVPQAPLYTKYVKKRHEYRIHVMSGTVIDRAEKLRRRGGDHNLVRNTANGYVFARAGINVPADVDTQALAAVRALGLDFGAVDIVYNERQARAYVLEVNTAPGIEGQTVRSYAAAFNRFFN